MRTKPRDIRSSPTVRQIRNAVQAPVSFGSGYSEWVPSICRVEAGFDPATPVRVNAYQGDGKTSSGSDAMRMLPCFIRCGSAKPVPNGHESQEFHRSAAPLALEDVDASRTPQKFRSGEVTVEWLGFLEERGDVR